jgi:hypothetical protein
MKLTWLAALLLAAGCASGPATTGPPSPPAPSLSATSLSPTPARTHHRHVATPAGTVRAYFEAINRHNYAKAWRVGGKNTGTPYGAFVSGFRGTAHDAVKILSVAGHTVTARLTARQTDGTTRTYRGTYVVNGGVITRFDVQQIQASTAPASCYPTAPSGNCYEPGQFCSAEQHGMTGVAGDGKTITCEGAAGATWHWR